MGIYPLIPAIPDGQILKVNSQSSISNLKPAHQAELTTSQEVNRNGRPLQDDRHKELIGEEGSPV